MKKVIKFFKEIDKKAHILACVLIVYVVADIDMLIFQRDVWTAMGIGIAAAVIVAVFKEIIDLFRGGYPDLRDIKADSIGAICGAILFVVVHLLA